jgi:putative ATP-dependent endonuclease of the OLD family
MKLTKIVLENFRSYRDLTKINVEDLTVFVGKNDAGKTSILEALEIFFNNEIVKLETADTSVGSDSTKIRIGCCFSQLPNDPIVLDRSATTSLKSEYLLNEDGDLEIHKIFECGSSKVSKNVVAVALHPSAEGAGDLLALKNVELKGRIARLSGNSEVDTRSNPSMRSFIWKSFDSLELMPQDIPLDKEDLKVIWEHVESWLPLYALFRSDRPSTDDDSEVQDPMKIAVQQALKNSQHLLQQLKDQVQAATTELAARTLDKLREIAPDLASELSPNFRTEPKWEQQFKMSLVGENEIPINKRGSGARRLILLSFFRASAESKRQQLNSPSIIYGVEEPETSQHPGQQRLMMEAFRELSEQDCQVLVTTHNPALAGLAPVTGIRYVRIATGASTVLQGQEILESTANDLGVLADHKVRVLVCVEGPNDCNFLRHISKLLSISDDSVPSLAEDPRVAFFHLGGNNLKQWVQNNYLKAFHRPEVHLYDRGDDQPPKFAAEVEQICERGDNSFAALTGKRDIENYLHPNAIQLALARLIHQRRES